MHNKEEFPKANKLLGGKLGTPSGVQFARPLRVRGWLSSLFSAPVAGAGAGEGTETESKPDGHPKFIYRPW
jgi:hypothetical protein